MKTSGIRIKKRYIVILSIFILLLAGYLVFVATRFSEYTTYRPFSGRVFNITSENVKSVRIVNGNTGYIADYLDDESIRELVNYINKFRYQYWIPELPLKTGGYEYALWLSIDGEALYFKFTPDMILVRGVWYECSDQYLSKLADLVA